MMQSKKSSPLPKTMITLADKKTIFQNLQPLAHPKQQHAAELFEKTDFPTTKNEDWKYTNAKAILQASFDVCKPLDNASFAIDTDFLEGFYRIVLVDGFYSESFSDKIEGVQVRSIKEAVEKNSNQTTDIESVGASNYYTAFDAMNLAYFQDGLFVHVQEKAIIDKPICVLSVVSSPQASLLQTRTFIKIGSFAKVAFMEQPVFQYNTGSFLNHVTEVSLQDNAHAELLNWQDIGQNSHIQATRVDVGHNSRFVHSVLSFSGGFIRNNLSIRILGENTEVFMNGLYRMSQKDFVDNHTSIDHTLPRSYSEQLYKGILDDSATAVFNGKIFVRQDAQKTNAYQSNKNILLSGLASVNTKPQLEIWANDVKCSHGSTVGTLDEEPLFYLRSRGLSLEQARKLLLHAYTADVLEKIDNPILRENIKKRVE